MRKNYTDLFKTHQAASLHLQKCAQGIVNFKTIVDEIEKAKPTGSLEEVFNQYCEKRSVAVECLKNFATSFDPCLTAEELDQKLVGLKITESLLKFMCEHEGGQIARESLN